MERGPDKAEHWFDLQPGQIIQGCLARSAKNEYVSVYVVTIAAKDWHLDVHERWPRVIVDNR